MVYLGDNWPDAYRNGVFMCNIHGNRVNHDLLEQKGSGYVAHHGADFLMANDPWFRGLNLVYGPDGGVYLQDWTDTGECHNHIVVDRSNGRIYKIVYGKMPKPVKVDIGRMSDQELVQLQLHRNDWYVRRARLQLAQRAAEGKLADRAGVTAALMKMFKEEASVPRRLRALWALYVIGDKAAVTAAVSDVEPQVKAWGVRLMVDGDLPPDHAGEALAEASKNESPLVRLAVASALRRIPAEERIAALHVLAARAEDSSDPNLPLMIWYAAAPVIEPAAASDFAQFVPATRIPQLREFSARLLAERGADDAVELLKAMVERSASEPACGEAVLDVMRGVRTALKDARLATPPEGWGQVAGKLAKDERAEVRRGALVLSLAFGDPSAQGAARAFVKDAANLPDARREVFGAIIQSRPADLAGLLRGMLSDPVLGEMAIRGLAAANDPQTPSVLLERYAGMSHEAKRDVLATLASRPVWAMALLKAIGEGKVPQADVGALTVRQLATLKDKAVDGEVAKLWGTVRAASADKVQLMTQYRQELAPDALKKADLANGRAVFNKTCAQCHVLFDSGGKLGPDLTGSQRANLDYVLENVLDPSAVVAKEYLMTVVHMSDDRVLTGIAGEETADTLVLKTPTENLVLRKSEIKSRKTESISMMPEGLLQGLTAAERRDLVGYLGSERQVALPGGK
jgi:putative heme-binding domain-containing protein